MTAIVQHDYGPPGSLRMEDIDTPIPADDEVRIDVRASALNPADWIVMRGPWFIRLMPGNGIRRPKHAVPGMDVAGIVDTVGRNVTDLKPGDEVFGQLPRGAFAEYACASPEVIARKPANLSFAQSAAMPLAGLTALDAMRDVGHVQPGQRMLIIGASGGVGTFAVQIAKAFGAEVTGVCSTVNVELVRSLGADHVVDYTADDFVDTDTRYDLILDNAASRSLRELSGLLTPTGLLLPNSANGGLARMAAAGLLGKVGRRPIRLFLEKPDRAALDALCELVESGAVSPVIDRTYPLVDTPAAVAYATQGHARGKVVITM